jgi:hypothetical protein
MWSIWLSLLFFSVLISLPQVQICCHVEPEDFKSSLSRKYIFNLDLKYVYQPTVAGNLKPLYSDGKD